MAIPYTMSTFPLPKVPVRPICQSLRIPHASYYRWRAGSPPEEADLALRDQIQRIALAWPCYGYRRITRQLSRQGIAVNHKRVLRLMRADNLLCLRCKAFVRTTDSAHGLAGLSEPGSGPLPHRYRSTLGGGYNVHSAFIRMDYLSVLLDAFSRRCIGWALGRTLETDLALSALQMALTTRAVKPGLVHHSDRGVQYASTAYTTTLKDASY